MFSNVFFCILLGLTLLIGISIYLKKRKKRLKVYRIDYTQNGSPKVNHGFHSVSRLKVRREFRKTCPQSAKIKVIKISFIRYSASEAE